jgi:hypothetical protein
MARTEREVEPFEAFSDSTGTQILGKDRIDQSASRSAAALQFSPPQRVPVASSSDIQAQELEPGQEEPCAARKGLVVEIDGPLTHFCVECGRFARFGFGVRLRLGKVGQWYCKEHRPTPAHPR